MLKSVCLHVHMHVRVYFSVICSLFCLACFIYLGKLSPVVCGVQNLLQVQPGVQYKPKTGTSNVCAVWTFLAFGFWHIYKVIYGGIEHLL